MRLRISSYSMRTSFACALALAVCPLVNARAEGFTADQAPPPPPASASAPAKVFATSQDAPLSAASPATPAATPTTGAVEPTAATPAPAAAETAASPAAPVSPPVDPIIAAIRQALQLATAGKAGDAEAIAALDQFYATRTEPALWVAASGLTPKGKSVLAEIGKAADWGLAPEAFDISGIAQDLPTPETLANAEIKTGIAVLKYARHARGGRTNPGSISQLLDVELAFADPNALLADLAKSDTPDELLRGLNPQQAGFQNLRKALLAARGGTDQPAKSEPAAVPGADIKLPPKGNLLKPGIDHPDVAMLRERLQVPAEGASPTVYDDKLFAAVKDFQKSKGLSADGLVATRTRAALNGEPVAVAEPPSKEREIQRILLNMERWRWVPRDLGPFYVWNNIPEYATHVVKNGEEIFKERIVVGQPSWPTPVFSAKMQFIVFQPEWGVPDGIKTKELLPRLRKYSSQPSIFDFFTGSSGYASSVLKAYNLRVSYNGRAVDPNSVNWGSTDIRAYSFTQPAGSSNVLGNVKFRFPNKHDVYMHDTTQKNLFAGNNRAQSHGCIRVQNPRRLAEVLLAEDKGWSAEKVGQLWNGGGGDSQVTLDKPIETHMVYMTAVASSDGKLSTYGDIYGQDSRLAQALFNKSLRFDAPAQNDNDPDVLAVAGDGASDTGIAEPRSKQKTKAKKYKPAPNDLAEAISGLLGN